MWKKELLHTFPNMCICIDEPLRHYTYTKTGGKADAVAFPSSKDTLQTLLIWAKQQHIPVLILGNGSNVIVKDSGFSGIVILLEKMNTVTINETIVTVESGMTLIELAKIVRDNALTGLEFASGIPGSVGGAVFMNAGAYGGEMKDIIESVTVVSREGQFKCYSNKDMAFSYRHSLIQDTHDIIIETQLKLLKGKKEEITTKMDYLTALRQEKQPLEYPSCGSVFKRPDGFFAGKLIQDAGLQGKRIGGVEVSKKHAGFMVNVANGTASDYKALIEHVQSEVKRQFNVNLETEVKFIGD